MEGLLCYVWSVFKNISDVFPNCFKFHGIQTSAFPPYTLPMLWSNIIFILHAIFFSFSTSSLYTWISCSCTSVNICWWRNNNLLFSEPSIFGAYRYLSNITLFPRLKRRAVKIQALWVVAASDVNCMCTIFINTHIYLSAGSTASHSVSLLFWKTAVHRKNVRGKIYYSHIPLSN